MPTISFASSLLAFNLGGELLPDEIVFTVELANLSAGVDIGLNLYNPPIAIGDSSTQFLIVRGTSFAETAAGTNSNLYFALTANASPVPEPASILLSACGLAALFTLRRHRF